MNLKDKYFPVLDHGFIALKDMMGSDEDIEQAARVSYGKGTRKKTQTRGLIRYLLRHRHTSPFEMCLSGDTKIPIMSCKDGARKSYTIRELADVFKNNKPWAKLVNIKSVDKSGNVYATKIKDCKSTGIKPTYRIVAGDKLQRTICVTDNHPFMVEFDEYKEVKHLCVGDEIYLNGKISDYKIYKAKIKSIEYIGETEVFDLEVDNEDHNFVAEGFVVHNCEFKFHVRVPMDCWRQWIRHRTASVNEYSTRYSEAINLCQQTSPDKWRLQSPTNKQGSGDYYKDGGWLSTGEVKLQNLAQLNYKRRLACGIAREQARKDLPLSTYTEAYWKIDLHNLLHFLCLRCDSHAQLEIRSYANVIAGIVKKCCPLTFEAWEDYTFGVTTFSRQEMMALQKIMWTTSTMPIAKICSQFDMNQRETNEFLAKLHTQPRQFNLTLPEPKPYKYFQEDFHEKSDKMAEPTS